MQKITGVTDDVLVASILGWKQITDPGIVTAGGKSAADDAGELAGDKDAQGDNRTPLGMNSR
jgi:hypothetical protein